MLKPLYNQLLLECPDEKDRKEGVLFMPETVNPASHMVEAKVLAIGDGLIGENGQRLPMSVKVGDVVLINRFSQIIIFRDKKYFLTPESNVAGIIPNETA